MHEYSKSNATELLARLIRFDSYWFRVAYICLICVLVIIGGIDKAGSTEGFIDLFKAFAERPLFGLVEMPILVDIMAAFITTIAFILTFAAAMNPLRPGALMKYTPQRYVIAVITMALVLVASMISRGDFDVSDYRTCLIIFGFSTFTPLMLLFVNPRFHKADMELVNRIFRRRNA